MVGRASLKHGALEVGHKGNEEVWMKGDRKSTAQDQCTEGTDPDVLSKMGSVDEE